MPEIELKKGEMTIKVPDHHKHYMRMVDASLNIADLLNKGKIRRGALISNELAHIIHARNYMKKAVLDAVRTSGLEEIRVFKDPKQMGAKAFDHSKQYEKVEEIVNKEVKFYDRDDLADFLFKKVMTKLLESKVLKPRKKK